MLRIVKLICFVLLTTLVVACAEPLSPPAAPPDKIAFLALPDGSDQWKIFMKDPKGIRQLVRIREDATNLWKIDASHVAFETRGAHGTFVYAMSIESDRYDVRASFPTNNLDYLLSPEGNRIIRVDRMGNDDGPGPGSVIWVYGVAQGTPMADSVMNVEESLSLRAWNCKGDAVYLLDRKKGGRIIRLDLSSKTMKDVTPDGLKDHEANWVSLSCDETVMVISASRHSGEAYKLFIFRNGKRIDVIDSDSVVDPFVAGDGSGFLYVDNYGKEKNRIKYYHIESGRIFEMVGPDGAYAVPVILEDY